MPYLTWRRAAGTMLCAGVLTAGSVAAATAAQASPQRVPIAGTHPSWAKAATRVGASSLTTGAVTSRIYLEPRDAAGLAALATEVSTPGTALYRHFLTPQQLQARFGATPAQISAIRTWLSQSGLRVTGVSDYVAGGYVAVSGSLAAASRAFHVTFANYRVAGQGVVRAPQQAASAPADVAASVLSVSGLSTARELMRPQNATTGAATTGAATTGAATTDAATTGATTTGATSTGKLPRPGPNYWVAKPCAAYYGQIIATSKPKAYGRHWPWAVCGYTPAQVRAAYGVTASRMTGKGQTVAVVDAYASPTMLRDANQFSRLEGEPEFAPGQYQQYLPSSPFTQSGNNQCGAQGWYGEETLDVESVHDMAPAARVRFVAAASCQDPDLADALSYIVNHRLASIVSDSWGDTEAGAAEFLGTYHVIFEAGAAEGIEFAFSSGDDGYEAPGEDPGGSTHLQVDYPTSDPFVTSVGGTSLAIGKADRYKFETAWGTVLDPLAKNGRHWKYALPGGYPYFFDGGSGGGTSTQFEQPRYQQGVVPDSLSQALPGGGTSATPMREVPDISAYADPATGMLVGETVLKPSGHGYEFALSRIGGTSVSCPTFAGIEADAQQAAGGPLGFANPAIYYLYGADKSAFHDVTNTPLGPGPLAQVRVNYANPNAPKGKKVYYLRTLGIDGEGRAALTATVGYDDATGVGSPAGYILAVQQLPRY
jgi:subtilase family serine protease